MPKDRFYLDDSLTLGTTLMIEGGEWHHLVHVMRIEEGEIIEIVNGKGVLAEAKITAHLKKGSQAHILTSHKAANASTKITLAFPIMRPSKLEWIIEKGSELGVDAFWIYPSHLGEKKGVSPSTLERLRALSIAAMKQSGRLYLPHLELISDFSELFRTEATILYGDTVETTTLTTPQFPVLFITGAEGGFSDKERKILKEKGKAVQLNINILRAESAPIVAASILSHQLLQITH